MKLENWSLIFTDFYQAPELQRHRLQGDVYDDPTGREDGKFIITSYVDKIENNVVTTSSGRSYLLGEPALDYVEFCRNNGFHVPTKDCPIKLI